MTEQLERYLVRLHKLNISVAYSAQVRFVFTGEPIETLIAARKYLCEHPALMEELASLAGYHWANDSGKIEGESEFATWCAVIAPLTHEECIVSDHWAERQAMRYADGLADDFHSTYQACYNSVACPK